MSKGSIVSGEVVSRQTRFIVGTGVTVSADERHPVVRSSVADASQGRRSELTVAVLSGRELLRAQQVDLASAKQEATVVPLVRPGKDEGPVLIAICLEKMAMEGAKMGGSDAKLVHNALSHARVWSTDPTAVSRAGSQALWRKETWMDAIPRQVTG